MKQYSMWLGVIAIIGVLFSCGTKKVESTTNQSEGILSEKKVYMVTDSGGVNDKSFNQSAWEGLQAFNQETGVQIRYLESSKETDILTNIQLFTNQMPDLIWGVGYLLADSIEKMAKRYPNQKYGIIDYSYPDGKLNNVVGVLFRTEENSFLAGYLATLMTKTNKLGFIGGMEGAIIDTFHYGYWAGVNWAAKKNNKKIAFYSDYIGNWTDTSKGKAIASNMITKGADIILAAAGPAGSGNIEAARERKTWAIGVDRDQYELAPNNMLISVVKEVGQAMALLSESYLTDSVFPGGQTVSYGLKEKSVSLAFTGGHVPQELQEKLKEIEKMIIDGVINVPYNRAMYDDFMDNMQ